MREKILDMLDNLEIKYENFEHKPVFTCEDGKGVDIPGLRVKSLLLRNKRATVYYMVVIEDKKQLNCNLLRKLVGENKMTFASEERMINKIGVKPGSVSPFALINNEERDVIVHFDIEIKGKLIGFHPGRNDNTTVLQIEDMEKFLNNLGFEVNYLEL